MLTREQVLQNPEVREAIRDCGSIFKKIDIDELVLKENGIIDVEGIKFNLVGNNLYIDRKKEEYLYQLVMLLRERPLDYITALILLDKDMNVIEVPEEVLNDVWSYGNWIKVEGCLFCCETNGVLLTTMKNGNDTIYSTIRMDIRPEDDLYQLDTEIAYQTGDDTQHISAIWSNDAININYCPICGRRLRKGETILYRGINVNYNKPTEISDEPEKIVKMRNRIIDYQRDNEYLSKLKSNNTIDEKELKAIIEDKSEPIKDRIYAKIGFILNNIALIKNKVIRMGVLEDLEYVINNSLVWDDYIEGQLIIIIEDKLLSNKEEK